MFIETLLINFHVYQEKTIYSLSDKEIIWLKIQNKWNGY